jgi:hypothetical protein
MTAWTGRASTGHAASGQRGGWADCGPELVIAGLLVGTLSVIALLFGGLGACCVVLAAAAVLALCTLRLAAPQGAVPGPAEETAAHTSTSFTGFWRKRAMVNDATQTLAGYDFELRGILQNLLAARLAERYGISLYHDPAAARRQLVRTSHDQALWYWLDPARPALPDAGSRAGIPPRTLAAVLDRLEKL